MSKKTTLKPLAVAMGAAFVTSLAGTGVANAADNPFAMSDLSSGYMVVAMAEGKCGEGKCGMKGMDADGDGNVTKDEFMQGHDAMFGKMDANSDGMLDADEQAAAMKMMKEGKCGEGKCGEGKCGEKMMKPGDGSEGKAAE